MNLRAESSFQAGAFARLEALIVPKLLAGAKAAAAAVLEESQALVPVESDELHDSGNTSVSWEGMKVEGFVSYSAHHAAFVEFGTGIMGRGTYPFDLPAEGTPFTGAWVYDYKQQNWVGMVARPYLRPALDIAHPRVLAAFKEALAV